MLSFFERRPLRFRIQFFPVFFNVYISNDNICHILNIYTVCKHACAAHTSLENSASSVRLFY